MPHFENTPSSQRSKLHNVARSYWTIALFALLTLGSMAMITGSPGRDLMTVNATVIGKHAGVTKQDENSALYLKGFRTADSPYFEINLMAMENKFSLRVSESDFDSIQVNDQKRVLTNRNMLNNLTTQERLRDLIAYVLFVANLLILWACLSCRLKGKA